MLGTLLGVVERLELAVIVIVVDVEEKGRVVRARAERG